MNEKQSRFNLKSTYTGVYQHPGRQFPLANATIRAKVYAACRYLQLLAPDLRHTIVSLCHFWVKINASHFIPPPHPVNIYLPLVLNFGRLLISHFSNSRYRKSRVLGAGTPKALLMHIFLSTLPAEEWGKKYRMMPSSLPRCPRGPSSFRCLANE